MGVKSVKRGMRKKNNLFLALHFCFGKRAFIPIEMDSQISQEGSHFVPGCASLHGNCVCSLVLYNTAQHLGELTRIVEMAVKPLPVAGPSQQGPRPMKATSWLLSQGSHFLAQLPFSFPIQRMPFPSLKPA